MTTEPTLENAMTLIEDIQIDLDAARQFRSINFPVSAMNKLRDIQRLLNAQWPPEPSAADEDWMAELAY